MKVIIQGPNLNDQSKGTFHVHTEGCRDNAKYGPRGTLGGESEPFAVEVETVEDVVIFVYSDHIDEQPTEEREDYVQDLVNDFWFAPCIAMLPNEQRRDDDERRAAEGDDQRDYAEERANEAHVREESESELGLDKQYVARAEIIVKLNGANPAEARENLNFTTRWEDWDIVSATITEEEAT